MADLGFSKGGSSVDVTDCVKHAKRTRKRCVSRGDMGNLDFRPSEIAFGAVLGCKSKNWTTNCKI